MTDTKVLTARRLAPVIWAALLGATAPTQVIGETGETQGVFVSGTLEMTMTTGSGQSLKRNQMIRGESPFDYVRLRLFGDVVVNNRLAFFNDFLIDPAIRLDFPSFLRSYVRFTAFRSGQTDLSFQGGSIPTPFGTFGARSYSDKNPLIGTPLMYHYFSSLRANQLPASNADLIRHRGRGLAEGFSGFKGGGSAQVFSGLPMVYDSCWDFGLEAVGSVWRAEYLLAVTQGTVSSPRMKGVDNNNGKQVAVRLGFVPLTGLVLGLSYARGPYLDAAVGDTLRARGKRVEDFNQDILGFDAEYSFRHLKVIGEFAANRWGSPNIRDEQGQRADLKSYGWYVEGKYTMLPGVYGAVRYEGLSFGKIDDGSGTGKRVGWDYRVRRWELGLGYYVTNEVIGKAIWQVYSTGAPGAHYEGFLALQLSASF